MQLKSNGQTEIQTDANLNAYDHCLLALKKASVSIGVQI